MSKAHESDGWRIEVSPKAAEKQDYFLNVLQVGDAEPDAPALPTTLIETEHTQGRKLLTAWYCSGSIRAERRSDITFSFEGEGNYQIMVADVEAGTYLVTRDGAEIAKARCKRRGRPDQLCRRGRYLHNYVCRCGCKQAIPRRQNRKNDEGVTLRIANKFVYTDVAPTIINDRTLVPMRVIF